MKKVIVHPLRFVVGPGVLADVGAHAAALGKRVLVIGGERAIGTIKEVVTASLEKAGVAYHIEQGSHVDKKRPLVDALIAKGREFKADVVIAAGGGRVVDAGKAVAHGLGAWLISAPTIASTNATATTSASIEGDSQRSFWYVGPHTVIADTRIIAQAGGRYLAAGMADALPTWTGGRVALRMGKGSGVEHVLGLSGAFPSGAAITLAAWTYETILEYGERAYHAAEMGAATAAVDRVVEAIVYGGGVAGPAVGGVGGEHSLHPANSPYATRPTLHGEQVGFGILVAMHLMHESEDELLTMVRFNQSVKLPTTFADFGVQEPSRQVALEIARGIIGPSGKATFGLWYEITPETLCDAMREIDYLGRREKGED
jgi:glycerol dehydrogenase